MKTEVSQLLPVDGVDAPPAVGLEITDQRGRYRQVLSLEQAIQLGRELVECGESLTVPVVVPVRLSEVLVAELQAIGVE